MNFEELLAELAKREIKLRRNGSELDVRGEPEMLDASLVGELRSRKTALLEIIGNGEEWWAPPGTLTPEMLPLVHLSQKEIDRMIACVPGGAANIQDIYPLVPLQEGILFHCLMSSGGDPYLVTRLFEFDNRERLDAYISALQAVVERHDILRTGVIWKGVREPVQIVWRRAPLQVEEVELDPEREPVEQLRERFDCRHFRVDITQAPLLRLYFAFDPGKNRWLMARVMHHLAGDATTLHAIQSEVQAYLLGDAARLPTPIPFRDFVAQVRAGMNQPQHETYFRGLLADVDEATAPFGILELPENLSAMEEAEIRVGPSLSGRIHEQARKLKVSTASLFHLAYATVVAKTSGREDVVFGTVLFGRFGGGEAWNRMLGPLINTLPIRIRIGAQQVKAGIREVQGQLAELMLHEQTSLVLAQRCSGVAAPAPLFSAIFNYQSSPMAGPVVSQEKERPWEGIRCLSTQELTNYAFSISVRDSREESILRAQAPAEVGAMRMCDFMEAALKSLVGALEACTDKRLCDLDVLAPSERDLVLHKWNDTDAVFPRGKCVHHVFEEQVQRSPDAVAVVFNDNKLSYTELNRRANQLAHHLIGMGVSAGDRVVLALERSIELIAAQIAILKCGACYMPIDPFSPQDRKVFLIVDSGAKAVLCLSTTELIDTHSTRRLNVDELTLSAEACGNPDVQLDDGGVAYVMYTSGSTGQPKGAIIPHRAIKRLVLNNAFARFDSDSTVAFASSPAFDASTLEVWAPLLNGGRIVIIAQDILLNPAKFGEALRRYGIDTLWMTVGLFNRYADVLSSDFAGLRYLMTGGDSLDPTVIERFLHHGAPQHFLNGYGPTETTTFATTYEITSVPGGARSIPIGKPIANTRVYILDAQRQPVPVGVTGELYIGGDGVALGYLNRPELTAERFLPDPFSSAPGTLMYRTGDLARWLVDGNIDFRGRNDFQVKIRGFRIELGEIEAGLKELDGVRESVVVAREDSPGDKRLVAYYTGEDELPAEQIRSQLSAKLPEYMMPAAFVKLDALPLTPNGKCDRKALPLPGIGAFVTREYEAPVGEIESALALFWGKLLKIERVGRHDNFFDLGGHSLMAMQVISYIDSELKVHLPIRALFQAQTVAQLAASVSEASATLAKCANTKWDVLIEIQTQGSMAPLFCVARPNVNALGFLALSRALGTDQPLYGLQSQMEDDPQLDFTDEQYRMAAEQYIRAMKSVQPHGPYHLAGQCQGSYIAFEMVRQLEDAGENVAFLGILDTWTEENTRTKWKFYLDRRAKAIIQRCNHRSLAEVLTGLSARARSVLGTSSPVTRRSEQKRLDEKYWPKADFVAPVCDARVVVFRVRKQSWFRIADDALGWRDRTRTGVTCILIPGDHQSLWRQPHVREVAAAISPWMGSRVTIPEPMLIQEPVNLT